MMSPVQIRRPNPEKPEMYVDLDGVVTDFYRAACAMAGRKVEDAPPGALATCDVSWIFNRFKGKREKSHEEGEREFWWKLQARDSKWWSNLQTYDDAVLMMLNIINLLGAENVAFLTSPSEKATASATGKVDFILDFCRKLGFQLDWVLTPFKWRLARPGVILLDDNVDNCVEFREFGGDAILYDAPWNQGGSDVTDVIAQVRGFCEQHASRRRRKKKV